MEKSSDAFRTISEVADDLAVPQHVLRFWETRFSQVRPLKRAGGRRYYRPGDIRLLEAIRKLLYDEGYTIKGVQRLLKDQGAKGVRTGLAPVAFALEPLEDSVPSDPPDVAASDPDVDTDVDPIACAADANDADPTQSIFVDSAALREALSVIEDCERILRALAP